jgi:hypothetical protein
MPRVKQVSTQPPMESSIMNKLFDGITLLRSAGVGAAVALMLAGIAHAQTIPPAPGPNGTSPGTAPTPGPVATSPGTSPTPIVDTIRPSATPVPGNAIVNPGASRLQGSTTPSPLAPPVRSPDATSPGTSPARDAPAASPSLIAPADVLSGDAVAPSTQVRAVKTPNTPVTRPDLPHVKLGDQLAPGPRALPDAPSPSTPAVVPALPASESR